MSHCMAPPLRDVGVSVGMVTPKKQAGGNKQIKGFCKQITEFVRSVFKLAHKLCT